MLPLLPAVRLAAPSARVLRPPWLVTPPAEGPERRERTRGKASQAVSGRQGTIEGTVEGTGRFTFT